MNLQKQELLNIKGGAFSASLLNGFVRGLNTLLGLGRSLGSSIRRLYNGKVCNY